MKILPTLLLLPLFLAPPLMAQDNGSGNKSEARKLKTIAEEVEIMRRVLVKSLCKTAAASTQPGLFPLLSKRKKATLENAAYLAYYQSLQNHITSSIKTHGYYLPGQGVLYTLECKVAVKQVEEPENKTVDAWEEARREYREKRDHTFGAFQKTRTGPRKKTILDPDAIAILQKILITTLARHADKMKHLPQTENFILAITLQASSTRSFSLHTTQQSKLIIQAPKKVFAGVSKDDIDLSSLEHQVRITQY